MMSSKVLSFPARSWVFGANTLSPKSFKLLPGLNQAIEYQSNAIAGSVKLRVQQARTFSCSSSSRLVSQMPTTRPSCSNTRHFKIHFSPLIIPKQAGSGVGSNFLQKSSFSSSASAFAASASNSGPSVFYRLSRGISFLFYTAVVVGGIGIFGYVVYAFVDEILLPSSDISMFNKTFSIIKKDPECLAVLGDKIKAHGEETSNKWSRNRPLLADRKFDMHGREHLWMQFHVEGTLAGGLVRYEMIRDPNGSNTFEYRYLVLEVPSRPRIYLIDNTPPPPARKTASSLFWGIKWGKKDDEK